MKKKKHNKAKQPKKPTKTPKKAPQPPPNQKQKTHKQTNKKQTPDYELLGHVGLKKQQKKTPVCLKGLTWKFKQR